MKRHSLSVLIVLAIGFLVLGPGAQEAEAGKWRRVASLSAGGGAKEVAINRNVQRFRIVCTEGSVIINTVVVREGAKTTSITIGQRLNKDDKREFSIPAKANVTGLRISDAGRGQYVVHVRD